MIGGTNPNVVGGVFGDGENDPEGGAIRVANCSKFTVIINPQPVVQADPQAAGVVFKHGGDVSAGQTLFLANCTQTVIAQKVESAMIPDPNGSVMRGHY